MKTGAKILKKYRDQLSLDWSLSLEEMIDAELDAISKERDEAQARIKASQGQEHVGETLEFLGDEKFIVRISRPTNVGEFLFAEPVITQETVELLAEIERLKDALSRFKNSEFNPDWSMLSASQESLREHMHIIKTLTQKIREQQAMFYVNMLRAYPEKTHNEVADAINSVGGMEELTQHDQQVRDEAYEKAAKVAAANSRFNVDGGDYACGCDDKIIELKGTK